MVQKYPKLGLWVACAFLVACDPPSDTMVLQDYAEKMPRQDLDQYVALYHLDKASSFAKVLFKKDIGSIHDLHNWCELLFKADISSKLIYVLTRDWIREHGLRDALSLMLTEIPDDELDILMLFRQKFRDAWVQHYPQESTSGITEQAVQNVLKNLIKSVHKPNQQPKTQSSEFTGLQLTQAYFKHLKPGVLDLSMVKQLRKEWLAVKNTVGAEEREWITMSYSIVHQYPCYTQCACMAKHLGRLLARLYPNKKLYDIEIRSRKLKVYAVVTQLDLTYDAYASSRHRYKRTDAREGAWTYHRFLLFESQPDR